MFKESNRIIVVDNSLEDLNKIAHEFNHKGIGCRTILYDGITFPQKPLTGIRIAFFDINLSQAFSENDRYATLENAIQSYISPENGPYILIFWTNKADWKNNFIEYINREPNVPNIVRDQLQPLYISTIDKTLVSEENTLETMLKEQLGNQIVELCMDIDNQLVEASSRTISTLLSMIPVGNKWGEPVTFEDEFKKLFSKIAVSSYGLQNAKENPNGAIKEALLPVLTHSMPERDIWKPFLSPYISGIQSDSNIILGGENAIEKLNNFFLIEETINNPSTRGAVVELDPSLFQAYFNISYPDWKIQEFGESPKITDAYPIAVEISAACDYSQQNHRIHKYLIGIACAQKIPDRKKINICLTDVLLYDMNPLYIALDFNYIFVNQNAPIIKKVLFGFKKEMMDMIGNKYANHISRIGITSFK